MPDDNDQDKQQPEPAPAKIKRCILINKRNLACVDLWRFNEKRIEQLFPDEEILKIFSREIARNKKKRLTYFRQNPAAIEPVLGSRVTDDEIERMPSRDAERLTADLLAKELKNAKKKGNRLNLLSNRMHDELTRITMTFLYHASVNENGEHRARRCNATMIAEALSVAPAGSIHNSLTEWVLPMLQGAGFIDGFRRKREYPSQEHEIHLTLKGYREHLTYLQACDEATAVVDEEIKDIDECSRQRGSGELSNG
jgi:hypothetical protein